MKLDNYIRKLNLEIQSSTKIEHKDSLSSFVYKLLLKNNTELILKICYDPGRYRRELYFLNRLKGLIPVPKIVGQVEPKEELQGAILMECLQGEVLNYTALTHNQASKMGELLGRVHEIRTKKYGDLTNINEINKNKNPIQEMFDYLHESILECKGIVSKFLLDC